MAVHQPNYLPGLGFFRKAAAADVLILLDTADFSRDSYTQRTRIRGGYGGRWLTVPVEHRFYGAPICEVALPVGDWVDYHFRVLKENYGRCGRWGNYAYHLKRIYSSILGVGSFSRWNGLGISWLAEELGLHTRIVWATDLIDCHGEASETLCRLVGAVDGDVYVSGAGGRKYMDEAPFREAGIDVEYREADPYQYSALDYLLRGGETL